MADDSEQRARLGATRLGLLDVLTALVILAVLLYAAWKQFPAFNQRTSRPSQQSTVSPTPHYGLSGGGRGDSEKSSTGRELRRFFRPGKRSEARRVRSGLRRAAG